MNPAAGRAGEAGARARGRAWPALRVVALAACFTLPAEARNRSEPSVTPEILHEPLPPDPAEDMAMHAAPEHRTSGSTGSAPNDRSGPAGARTAHDSAKAFAEPDRDAFSPDRDTRRPSALSYVDPFTPSTAPFKRLWAFDAVHADYTLYVRSDALVALASRSPDPEDQLFYGDVTVDLSTTGRARLPSVGPGAKLVRAHLAIGDDNRGFRVLRDGAENWYVEWAPIDAATRGRLVMELAIAPSAFAGPFADVSWTELAAVPPLPDNIAREAAQVATTIGVSRRMRPREAVARLVQFFRSFSDSVAPLPARGSVYTDVALSKKGVCRHRSFAFLVTAQSLGIPTRFVANEAHAWVEVDDGTKWRRIDLGGAGDLADGAAPDPSRPIFHPPPDTYPWPPGAHGGDAMMADVRQRTVDLATELVGGARADVGMAQPAPTAERLDRSKGDGEADPPADDRSPSPTDEPERPRSTVTLQIEDDDTHRGLALHAHGHIDADGEPCPYAPIELWLEEARTRRPFMVGTLATDASGAFRGAIVVPVTLPLGDYDVRARTPGSARCGAGANE